MKQINFQKTVVLEKAFLKEILPSTIIYMSVVQMLDPFLTESFYLKIFLFCFRDHDHFYLIPLMAHQCGK